MPSTQALKTRIRSVKSTKKITGAMQLVAASKMRRAQTATQASSPYARAASELLTFLLQQEGAQDHPLFARRAIDTRLLIVVASDRGLAGAYNSNVMRQYVAELKADDAAGIKNETIAVGRKASQFVTRIKDTEILGIYEGLPDHPGGSELRSVLNTARDHFVSGEVDAVDIVYTEYVSSINQRVIIKRVLPAGFIEEPVTPAVRLAKYEPSQSELIDAIAYRLVGAQIFQALLDARASEHSMRMLAMKNATDNAGELVDDLTLAMNKVRQGAITQEIAEISGGAEALNG